MNVEISRQEWPYIVAAREMVKKDVTRYKPKVLRTLLLESLKALDEIETLMREQLKAASEEEKTDE